MPKKIQPEDDEWFGIQDPKKRKQIQDRLAQRARRTRLAKSKNHSPKSSSSSGTSPELSQDLICHPLHSNSCTNAASNLNLSHVTLSIVTLNVALYQHGLILGIPCVTAGIHLSRPPGPHVPASLRPVQLQLEEVHYTFIDRVPNKELRRNMIALSDSFSAEDFIADILSVPSFVLDATKESWDPSGWAVAKPFRSKWRILFDGVEISIV